jgi:hypothetical protein
VTKRRQLSEIFFLPARRISNQCRLQWVSPFFRDNLQRIIHFLEGLLSLLKETKDDGPRELAIIFFIIHLQDLLKGHGIDAISQVRQGDRALFTL